MLPASRRGYDSYIEGTSQHAILKLTELRDSASRIPRMKSFVPWNPWLTQRHLPILRWLVPYDIPPL
jgi:hypothetical protein